MSLKSFDPDIQTKLFDRIEVAGRKNPPPGEPVSDSRSAVIASLYAKTTWLRMSSLLLNAPILMGGELQSSEGEVNVLKEGFSDIYPEFGRGGVLDQPFRPMPGVKSASVDYRGYFLREGKIEWVCWSLEELERLKPYYLSIQKPVLLEWGWSYPNQFYDEGLVDLSSNSEELEGLAGKLPERIKKNGGDYDAMLGKISNFEWSVRPDGGFDCSTRLISQAANVLSNQFPSSTSSTRYKLDDEGELTEEGEAEVNFKAYIKNLKFQLTEIPEIKDEETYGKNAARGLINIKDGTIKVFYSNEKVWPDDEKKKEALDIGPYVTWGWMEDNIISRFVSKIEDGTKITGRFRSRQAIYEFQGTAPVQVGWESAKITNHKELYTVDPNRFILPGQYPVSITDPTYDASTAEGSYTDGSETAEKEKIRKVFQSISTGFAPFAADGDEKSGYLRNIVIHYKLIQSAFEDSNTVEEGIDYLLAELIRDFGQLWDFDIVANDKDSNEMGVVDHFAPGDDVKNASGNFSTPDDTTKLFKFPVQNKDSIVKSQAMRSTVPSSMQMAVAMSANSSEGSLFSTEGTTESIIADVWGGLQKEPGDTSSVTLQNPSTDSFGRKDADENENLEIGTENGVDVFGVGEDDPFTKSVDALTKAQKEEFAKLKQQSEDKEIVEAAEWPDDEASIGKIYHASGIMRSGYQQLMQARLYHLATGIDVAVLVPITLDIQIDGISGIELFQHFQVDYIPENYKIGSAFRVMGISQQIDSSTWNTTVKGQMVATRVS